MHMTTLFLMRVFSCWLNRFLLMRKHSASKATNQLRPVPTCEKTQNKQCHSSAAHHISLCKYLATLFYNKEAQYEFVLTHLDSDGITEGVNVLPTTGNFFARKTFVINWYCTLGTFCMHLRFANFVSGSWNAKHYSLIIACAIKMHIYTYAHPACTRCTH